MKRGFTLIELLVVIAIIGMLSSVVLSSLNSARVKSRDVRRISDLKQIQTALELYFDDQSTPEYPDALSSLVPNYIHSEPADPLAIRNYRILSIVNNVVNIAFAAGGGGGSGQQPGGYYYDNLTRSNGSCSASSGICSNYVLGSNLENSNHGALSSDTDSTVGSVNCADPVYCLVP